MQKNVLPAEKIYLPDGTELRLCKGIVSRTGNRKLYCSKAGLFYSLSTRGLNPNIEPDEVTYVLKCIE